MDRQQLDAIVIERDEEFARTGVSQRVFRDETQFRDFLFTLEHERGGLGPEKLYGHEKAHFDRAKELGYEVVYNVLYRDGKVKKLAGVSVDLDLETYGETVPVVLDVHRIQIALAPEFHPIHSRGDYNLAREIAKKLGEELK